jgi:predicted acetyltransferase
MSIEVRPFSGRARDFFDATEVAFGGRLNPEDVAVFEPLFEADRALGAYDGVQLVGTAGVYSFGLTVPGGELPAAGVTAVGVHPTHRRRGILRRLMRRQLDDVRQRGEPLAVLWASEGVIYQRFGYGLATLMASFELERERSGFRVPVVPAGSMRLLERDEAELLFPPIFERVRPARPGFWTRSAAIWKEFFHDPERWRRGAGPAFLAIHAVDGKADGYVRYRIKDEWDDRGSRSTLIVTEAIATTPLADREIWRYLLDVDLVSRVKAWGQAADHPLLLLLNEPRRLGFTLGDALWLRIVDVEAALAGRSYAGEGRLVIELRDEFCPWNAGRWAIETGGEGARVTRAEEDAELGLDAADLAALYLGAFSVQQLLGAGRGEELRPGAAARADILLRTAQAPWCPRVF